MEEIKDNYKFTIFDKLILKEFIKPYLGALVLIVVMTLVTELLERLDEFQKWNVKPFEVFLYYLYRSPFLIVQFSPIAIIFGTVFSLGLMAKNRELMSIIIGGVSFFRVVLYLYIAGFTLSIFFIFFNDIIGVRAQEKASEMDRKFKGITHRLDKQNLNMYGKENFIYHIAYYHYYEQKMDDIQIEKTSEAKDRIEFRIDAKNAVWDKEKNIWVFHDGIIRIFDEQGDLKSVERFDEKEITLLEKPKDFDYQQKDIDELSISEALKYIKNLQSKGFMSRNEWVDFHLKFSFPFACLLMMLIGAPLSIYSTKSVLIISFGLALLGSFIYWVFLSIGISLGKNGVLPPFLAVWMGNIFFAVVSYIVHKKVVT